jgi:RNA polymerase sigma-70 factor, ECF subfamily
VDLNDRALVEKILKTNDLMTFKSLVRRHQNRVYNTAIRIVGNADEAEEVVQETFIKVHQNLSKFRNESSFSSWMFRISHNICMDKLRSKQRRGFQFIQFEPQHADDPELSPTAMNQLPDDMPTPAEQLDAVEQEQVIADSIQQLPDNQRTVVVLHDVQGLSYQEISEITGMNLGTVRSRLHYGRLKLREILNPYFSYTTASTTSR